tara:strand:- start:2142 stop:2540 length:399 start_codon:yes stop_codon:yes gene_type:complete
MPDKKTLDKAKKAGAAPEEEMDAMADMEGMDESMDEGMEMAEGDMTEDPMVDDMPAPGGDAAGAVQAALDEGVSSAEEMMSRLMDAGFEIVPAAGGMAEEMPMEPPMGAPETAGDLRDRVRGAAARALGGMA